MKSKLTKGLFTREEALKLSPAYVAFIEQHTLANNIIDQFCWDYENVDQHGYPTCRLKKGQSMITFFNGQYVSVKVSAVINPRHEADGPNIRVTNGECSWRVDGDKYGVCL